MTSGAPWSVKGIDPKAREIAKDLARRSGMTLGEWLNRMIVEGETPAEPEPLYLETPTYRDEEPIRMEVAEHPADEVGRVTTALERLSERIELAEQRSTLAITGIDQSVRGALSRLEGAEREQVAVAARFEGVADDLRTEQQRLAERLRRMDSEAAGPRSAEALRALEGALGKVAGHLYEGEARTREAIAELEARVANRGDNGGLVEEVVARIGQRLEQAEKGTTGALRDLGASFVALDARLRKVEAPGGAPLDERLGQIAAELTARMELARAEMAEKLRAASEGRFDRMERKFGEMTAHVAAAEHRSAQALERMGREVVTMADTLSRRVQTVENRSADAIEQVGGEVARMAAAMEQRVGKADTIQAQALEKLGIEIARITERLAERIANSERRSALAIDDVGEQVARVTERITQRQERVSVDLAERIRQSEERTARLLDEAREKIDASLNVAHKRLSEQVASQAPAPARPEPKFSDPFAQEPFPGGPADDDVFATQAFARTPPETPPQFEAPEFPLDPPAQGPTFSGEDFDAAADFADIDEAPEDDLPPVPAMDIEEPSRPLSTREVIEQARAAARAASAPEPKVMKKTGGTSLFSGLGGKEKAKRRAGGTLQTALLVTGAAAALGAGAASYMLGVADPSGAPPQRVADSIAAAREPTREIATFETDTAPVPAEAVEPRAAVVLTAPTPAPAATPGAVPPAPAAAPPRAVENAASLYADGVRRVEAKDTSGVELLRKAANLGYAPAQFYLAKLYENGEAGLKKDLEGARRWTERAAQSGDRKAMHNLGLYYFEGTGGPKNSTTAAQWFRRAADLGLTDSQYNLGRLYEEGYGVSQNPAEAYKWYLIASRLGDGDSKTSAERVKKALSPEARSAAERSALGYRASGPAAPAAKVALGGAGAADVVTAQKALSRLGYYQGPQDGSASPALKLAVTAYQRDQNLPSTGVLDEAVLAKLAVYAR